MACSSPSSSTTDFDLQLAARAGLHSLHHFISIFSPASSSSSFSSLQQQQSMAAAETISKFKHLGALLSPCKGHARVRLAPRIVTAPAAATSADSLQYSCSPNPSPIKPNSPLGNPNFASECFQFSQINYNYGSGSTSLEECDSVGVDEEGQSIRGSSHIDLNNQIDNYDNYEGSINKFSRRAFYDNIEDTNKDKDNYSNFIANDHNNKQKLDINYDFPSKINDNNPTYFDLNQQAPSLDRTPSFTSSVHKPSDFVLPDCRTKAPLFCPHPILAFPPPPQESFSFDIHTQSAAATPSLPTPSASNMTHSAISSADEEFTRFTNNSNQRSTSSLYHEGQDQESLTRQLAQIFSTKPHFEAHLEKAACLIPTPTHSHLSCISVEGNLLTNGNLPPGPQCQPAMASMELEHNMKASSANLVKRKCPPNADDSKVTKCGNSPSKCHCAKRRKLKKKSTVRVPAISDKVAEIPHDDYSWRKYGQKPIKGSPYPRGYYKCSGVKGCPAKKHVERALDDPSMLIITYEGEHIHSTPTLEEPLQI